jgi:hypothetical protein
MMAIEDWMPSLAEVMEGVDGIERVCTYEDLPGSLLELPCLVIMPKRGSQSYGASAPGVSVHDVQLTLYTASQVIPEALGTAVPFIKKVRDQLAGNVKLLGSVAYCLPPPEPDWFYEGPGAVKYGEKDHVAVIFHVRVKEVEVVLVEA